MPNNKPSYPTPLPLSKAHPRPDKPTQCGVKNSSGSESAKYVRKTTQSPNQK